MCSQGSYRYRRLCSNCDPDLMAPSTHWRQVNRFRADILCLYVFISCTPLAFLCKEELSPPSFLLLFPFCLDRDDFMDYHFLRV